MFNAHMKIIFGTAATASGFKLLRGLEDELQEWEIYDIERDIAERERDNERDAGGNGWGDRDRQDGGYDRPRDTATAEPDWERDRPSYDWQKDNAAAYADQQASYDWRQAEADHAAADAGQSDRDDRAGERSETGTLAHAGSNQGYCRGWTLDAHAGRASVGCSTRRRRPYDHREDPHDARQKGGVTVNEVASHRDEFDEFAAELDDDKRNFSD